MSISNSTDSNSPIAFFDSGVGGLTVLNKVKKILPNENYIYYGDTIHVPYGEKSKAELLAYSDSILKFFEQKHCKAVVMACNTTSSVIYEDIKDKYNLILYPIVQSVSEILAELPIKKLGIFATRATVNSKAYQNEIKKYNSNMEIFANHCPEWVYIVENNLLTDIESISIIKNDLDKMLENNPEKIVLGCTHYPFLIKVLEKFASNDMFIDPAISFAEFIKEDLSKRGLLNTSSDHSEEFYVSSDPIKFKKSSKMFYELKSVPTLLNF